MALPTGLGAQESQQDAGSADIQEVFSWLPQDTETVTVARGPFTLPASQPRPMEDENRAITDQELEESFEGCAIALFADDINDDMDSFIKENRRSVLKVEQIGGHASAVFQEKLENDTWTTFVAFPSKRALVVATNKAYLEEVLARLHGKSGVRALPNVLPEWKYVNTELRFWGLRHFDRSQANLDPSSPFGGRKAANTMDEEEIGLIFAFDQRKGSLTSVTYLSGDTSLAAKPEASLLSMGRGTEARRLNIEYRELAPGVVEALYSLKTATQVQFFFFAFEGMLGHALFI